jgi:hypothetical protein
MMVESRGLEAAIRICNYLPTIVIPGVDPASHHLAGT